MLTRYGSGPHNEWVNIGTFLQFFMAHNQLVFGILLAAIFGLCAFLLYRLFFEERVETHSASTSDVGQIEETLKKILSQTTNIAPATGAAGPEVEKMKAELEVSQKMIAELQAKTDAGGKADNTPELLAKIKILEDRLSEYEIIEDDIADLSVYKEENAKLKKQLEAIKSGQSSPMVEDFAAAVENAPVGTELRGESVEEAVAAAEALGAENTGLDDALEAAMAEMNEPAFVPPTPAPAESVASAPQDDHVPTQSTTTSSTDDVPGTEDVFAEFQGDENKDLLSELGDIDADRMLEEIKDLGEGMQADADVLDEEVDLEKMAKESAKG